MGVTLNPYLQFDGEAADAIAFYADVLGGTTQVMTFGQMGMEGPDADKVMHGQLENEHGITLMVSDMPPGESRQRGNDVRISLSGDDEPTLRGWYEKLSAGGSVGTPLEKQMWGDLYGDCTDRFGVRWLVNISASG
ncbi:VOC family protein [Actinomycetospora lutea]|uniref:VOC family protein n=1 Tax=Actinomycetospora lutea TaxID=663604 RepID=UPI002365AD66|nr:VOC family protein [Actinomycetospora lutea]MDD7941266.1 VOC family protein [Actinomycetospora lutea]